MLKPIKILTQFSNVVQRQSVRYATNLQIKEKNHEKSQDMQNRMQAWQLHSYGEDLQLTSARIPYITAPTEVLVKVEAATINPIDYMMKAGYGKTMLNLMRGYELEFPLTLGRDFAGTIVDRGLTVDKEYQVGDKIYGVVPVQQQGSHAETVLVDQANICHRPPDLLPVESASVLYTALTAWSALYLTGDLFLVPAKGCKVLIIGASGGVGTVAVQMLKSQGAHVVGTCSTDAVPLVQSLGANRVYDYRATDYVANVASEGKFDIILDCAKFGYQNVPSTWNYSKFITLNGNLLQHTDRYGLVPGLALSVADLLTPNISGVVRGRTVRWAFFAPSKDALLFVDKLLRRRKISPTIHKVFKFSEMNKAFETFAQGHMRGKIVIDFT